MLLKLLVEFIIDHADPSSSLLSSDLSFGCEFNVCNIYFLHLGKGLCGILKKDVWNEYTKTF